jgi:hypothetical protein
MPKADLKTICGALNEGVTSLGGCTVFFGGMFDMIAKEIAADQTAFEPDFWGVSRWGFAFSMIFSVWAAYGAYFCHGELLKANQPDENTLEIIDIMPNEEINDADLPKLSTDTMVRMILNYRKRDELKSIKAAEDAAAKLTPLTKKQKFAIGGEYTSHSAGLAGFVLALIQNDNIRFEILVPLTALFLTIGFYTGKGDVRSAIAGMRLNNVREKLYQHHSLFKSTENTVAVEESKSVNSSDVAYKQLK